MAQYAISGVWKDSNDVITHYAIHLVDFQKNTISFAKKYSKIEAFRILDNGLNSIKTILWNYKNQSWDWGSNVDLVGVFPNKYLRTLHDGTERNNLSHLIDYGYITNNFI